MSIRIRSLGRRGVDSNPDPDGKQVTNLYVITENGNPKLKVEYEDG